MLKEFNFKKKYGQNFLIDKNIVNFTRNVRAFEEGQRRYYNGK